MCTVELFVTDLSHDPIKHAVASFNIRTNLTSQKHKYLAKQSLNFTDWKQLAISNVLARHHSSLVPRLNSCIYKGTMMGLKPSKSSHIFVGLSAIADQASIPSFSCLTAVVSELLVNLELNVMHVMSIRTVDRWNAGVSQVWRYGQTAAWTNCMDRTLPQHALVRRDAFCTLYQLPNHSLNPVKNKAWSAVSEPKYLTGACFKWQVISIVRKLFGLMLSITEIILSHVLENPTQPNPLRSSQRRLQLF